MTGKFICIVFVHLHSEKNKDMTNKQLREDHKNICILITKNKIADSFILLKNKILNSSNLELKSKFENQKQTYNFLLEYSLKGVNDPEKDKIYRNIQKTLLNINDSLKNELLTKSNSKLSKERQVLLNETNSNKITITSEINELLNNKNKSENKNRKSILYKLFFHIWLNDKITEEDANSLKKLSRSSKIFFHEKSIIISALTINLIENFDERKIISLFNFYDTDDNEVWNRALVGIVVSFYIHNKRIAFYDNLLKKAKQIKNDDGIIKYIEGIILQLIRTKETEKIAKKMRDEIIPEMQKFRPKIEEKLNLDDIISDSLIEDQNPDWEDIFDDAPDLLNKMADFSKMQLEGSDVFMSAFAMFKNFPFFTQVANWFMPFYANNTDLKDIFENFGENFDSSIFIEGLEKSAFMCNSDKYSFCMNLKMMPTSQRNMIVELFKGEMEQMKEISDDDELLKKGTKEKHISIRYIQDLYRFYKLHPLHNDFLDFFDTSLDIHNSLFFKTVVDDSSVLKKIADLYFNKTYYNEAIDALSQLKLKGKALRKNYEKLGFAWQKLKNYDKALSLYKKAELFNEPSLWLTKKIAFCYRKNNNFEEALKYYKIAEQEDSESLHIQGNIGHCYLSLNNYEDALKHYFKVEYYQPNNLLAKRPIAWCSFAIGKFDTSEKYYKKLLENKPTAFDFINYGHVLFCNNKKMLAIEMYLKGIKMENLKTFEDCIDEDKEILLKHSSENTDIDMLVDYVKVKML